VAPAPCPQQGQSAAAGMTGTHLSDFCQHTKICNEPCMGHAAWHYDGSVHSPSPTCTAMCCCSTFWALCHIAISWRLVSCSTHLDEDDEVLEAGVEVCLLP
jgi:hypothetical protein